MLCPAGLLTDIIQLSRIYDRFWSLAYKLGFPLCPDENKNTNWPNLLKLNQLNTGQVCIKQFWPLPIKSYDPLLPIKLVILWFPDEN